MSCGIGFAPLGPPTKAQQEYAITLSPQREARFTIHLLAWEEVWRKQYGWPEQRYHEAWRATVVHAKEVL